MKPFGIWLKEKRKEKKLTAPQAIARINETYNLTRTDNTWRQWENRGVDLPHDQIKMISLALEIPEQDVCIAAGVIPPGMQDVLTIYADLCPEQRKAVLALAQNLQAKGCPDKFRLF